MSRARPSIAASFALAILKRGLLVALAGALLAVTGVGCGTTGTADIVQPITGVLVRADTLNAGRGCGTAPGQLFKYSVLVLGLNAADVGKPAAAQRFDDFVAGNVYDCFTDGAFVELPVVAGSSFYGMEIYVYNRAAYLAAGGAGIDATLRRLQDSRVALVADGGGAQQRDAIQADLAVLRATNPTYSTTCTAQQLGLVQSVAACKALQLGAGAIGKTPGPASVELRLATFKTAGGTDLACDTQYATVRVGYAVGGARSAPTDKRCSALGPGGLVAQSLTIAPAQAPASYAFDVTLLRADGVAVGSTTCGADTIPGVASVADCKPLPLP